jgi:hypothetical protein
MRKEAIVVYYCGIFLEILRKTGRVQLEQPVSELEFEERTSKIQNITDINLYILCNQRDATYAMFFITIISTLHVSEGFSAHHQELIKLYAQPWVLSCFPAVYSFISS